jgi:TniQ
MIIDARLGNACDGMLPIRWAPLDEESPSSCILRLAAELGHPYATLCKFLNITRHEAARENLRAAQILRLSEREWKALTYGVHKVGRFCKRELRGHILNVDRLCLSRPRICPCCLLASGYCRWYWDLSLYCYCHIHRCEMVSKCDVCKQDVKWNRPAPSFCACGADLARRQPEARAEYGLLCSDIIIAAVQKEKACVSVYPQLLELSLDSVFYLLLRLSQLINRSSSLQTSSSDFAYCREVCLTAGSILADWPNGFHKLLGDLQAQRRYEHPNPMRDLFGSSYHAWLDLVRRPEFGFLVAEYQQFLLHSWKEPVPPQGHVFRLVGASSNVLSLAEAARKANVIPACVMGAYRIGEIEGHFARQKAAGAFFGLTLSVLKRGITHGKECWNRSNRAARSKNKQVSGGRPLRNSRVLVSSNLSLRLQPRRSVVCALTDQAFRDSLRVWQSQQVKRRMRTMSRRLLLVRLHVCI